MTYTCYALEAFLSLILVWGRFVVSGLWSLVPGYAVLTHIQPLGCPKILWSLPKPYWARFTLLSQLEGCQGIFTTLGIKSSQVVLVASHAGLVCNWLLGHPKIFRLLGWLC